jgi:hypothetical protein
MRNPRYGIIGGLLLALLLAAALLSACGGGGDKKTPEPTEEPSPAAEESPTGPAGGDTVQVDQTYWHAGFKVTLGEATLTEGDFGSLAVAIEAVFENLGDEDATPDSSLVLQSGGNNYTESTFDQDIPQVPAGLSSNGLITFQVDEEFSLEDATLLVGISSNNQATVPLTAGAGDLVSLEPQEIVASGQGTAGAVTAAISGGELRADLPDQHSEMEAGKLALTVFFSVTPQAGIQLGQGVLSSENLALKLPDGTSVSVRSDGVSGVNELLQGREGTTISDLSARFEVPEPAEGEYAFILKGKYGAGGAQVQAEVPFTVE